MTWGQHPNFYKTKYSFSVENQFLVGLTHLPRKKASVIQWFTFGLRKSCLDKKIVDFVKNW